MRYIIILLSLSSLISCKGQTKDTAIKAAKTVDSVSLIKHSIITDEKYKNKTVYLTSREAKFVIVKSRKNIWYRKYLNKANPR